MGGVSRPSPATGRTRCRSTRRACWWRGACFGLSVAQRRLSTPVRELRRRTVSVERASSGWPTGASIELSKARLAAPLDGALRALSLALVLLAAALVIVRL